MLDAMMRAEVGDDVYGEDPTVNALQDRIAEMFRKEAALFVPSGTMGNEIAIKAHTNPGDEIIVDHDSHILVYETGGPSFLSGVQMCPLAGDKGSFTPEQVLKAIRPGAYYMPRTSLVCLENTHGRSGGSVIPLGAIKSLRATLLEKKIPLHIDGARIWNAAVASGFTVADYADQCDTLSVCFSKGLGAPIGSIVIGSSEFIEKSRRYRKIFGGGMRQAGLLAAAAMYAIDNNYQKLKEDHAKARFFADEIARSGHIKIDPESVQTNMVIFEVNHGNKTQIEVLNLLKSHNILLTPERSSMVRAVMHLNVSMEEVKTAAEVVQQLFT